MLYSLLLSIGGLALVCVGRDRLDDDVDIVLDSDWLGEDSDLRSNWLDDFLLSSDWPMIKHPNFESCT